MDLLARISTLLSGLPFKTDADVPLVKGATIKAQVLESSFPGQIILRLGSRLLPVVATDGLEPGREIKLIVTETSPKLVLSLVPDNEADGPTLLIVKTTSVAPGADQPPGTIIQAKILDSPRPDTLRLRITAGPVGQETSPETKLALPTGQEVTARLVISPGVTREFAPGQEVRFAVVQTSPRLILHPLSQEVPPGQETPVKSPLMPALTGLISQPEQLIRGAVTLLAIPAAPLDLPEPIQKRLEHLVRLLVDLSPQSGPVDDNFVKRLAQGLGVGGPKPQIREAVARLWSETLRAVEHDQLKDTPEIRQLMEAAAKVFKAADQIQTINQETFLKDQTVHMTFPLFWSGQADRGELLFKKPSRSEAGPEQAPLKVALLLSMSGLGRIKADMELKNKAVNGVIWTETQQVRQTIQQGVERLISNLSARGFQVQGIRVLLFPAGRRPPDTLAEELKPTARGLIDVKV